MKIKVQDWHSIDVPSERTFTPEGFLRVPAHVARTGVQMYKAVELGLEGDPNRLVSVYRPEDVVFDPISLSKYNGIDITIEHPDKFVNSENYKDVTCGTVIGTPTRDDDHVRCELIIKDKKAIDMVISGQKNQLSVGYEAVYEEDPSGQYDFIQRDIEPNHLAIVSTARAGHSARIFDSQKGNIMTVKKITVDGIEHEVDPIVAAHIAKLTKDNDTLKAERDNDREEVKRVKKERGEADYDVEKLRERVRELEDEKAEKDKEKVTKDAKKLVGDSGDVVGDTVMEIKRSTLDSLGFDTKDESDDYVKALFDMQVATRDSTDSQHRQFADDANQLPKTHTNDSARDGFINRLTGGK